MKLSAFTIIKDGIKLDYPFVESIKSILPIVDEYIINVGKSKDGTLEVLKDLAKDEPKIRLLVTKWEGVEKGTAFFSSQTNEALRLCEGEWVFYLQADEVLHEKDANKVRGWIERAEAEGAQGITFQYYHFEKDYNHLRKTYKDAGDAYDIELRVFKNNDQLHSFGDAQSFSFTDQLSDPRGPQPALHRPELFIDSTMHIYHYGYVKDPKKMLEKKKHLEAFYDVSEPGRKENIPQDDNGYVFNEDLVSFPQENTHPAVMRDRIERFGK